MSDILAHQAESVSRKLGVPILIHPQPKPGCAQEIISYFQGDTPIDSISSKKRVRLLGKDLERTVVRTIAEDYDGSLSEGETLLGRRPTIDRVVDVKGKGKATDYEAETTRAQEPLKILVVGDRLATDVLLARRLDKFLSRSASSQNGGLPPTLSIITTRLFKQQDVRILRWIENRWARLGRRTASVGSSRQPWETFLLQRSLDELDVGSSTGPSRLRRLIGFILAIPSGLNKVRKWRPPTTRQIVAQTQQSLMRNVKKAGPIVFRGLRTGLGAVGTRARSILPIPGRSRAYSHVSFQRRQFGSLGGMRLNAKHDDSLDVPVEGGKERQAERRYQQFVDDADYSEFSVSLDRLPMRGQRSIVVDHLETLSDKEIVIVLDEVLGLRAGNPFLENSDLGLISVMLSIRSRSSYGKILQSISPESMAGLISTLVQMGATHLCHLILHDLSLRPRISDDVKMAVFRRCSILENTADLDKSYLSRLVSSLGDEQLGIASAGETGIAAVDGDRHVRLAALLEGYLAEKVFRKTEGIRIYRAVYAYTAEIVSRKYDSAESNIRQVREARWLSYRIVALLLERGEMVQALKVCKVLGQAGWLDLSVFAGRQAGGQNFEQSTALFAWCGIIGACNDLQWLDRCWDLVRGAKKHGANLTGTNDPSLDVWSATIDRLIQSSTPSREEKFLGPARELLLGPPLVQFGLVLEPHTVQGFYDAYQETQISVVWSVYRRLRSQGYPPPRDGCLLRLVSFLNRSTRTQLSIETLVKDIEAHPGSITGTQLPWLIVHLAGTRSHESARRFYERALASSGSVRDQVVLDPHVVYVLVKAFGGKRTLTNQRSYDREFAKTVVAGFIVGSGSISRLSESTIALLARSFVLLDSPESAIKLFERVFGKKDGLVNKMSGKKDGLINAMIKGEAEAGEIFARFVLERGIELTPAQVDVLRRWVGRKKRMGRRLRPERRAILEGLEGMGMAA
jgi:hypothetical protein